MSTYFFTSNSQARYKNDAVLALAYAKDHVITLRYNQRYVSQAIRAWVTPGGELSVPAKHRHAFLIYADSLDGSSDFRFYPLRSAIIVRAWVRSESFFAALQLKDYVCYRVSGRSNKFQEWITNHQSCPHPKSNETPDGSGCFFLESDERTHLPKTSSAQGQFADAPWRTIVDELVKSPSFRGAVFWRIDGIYRLRWFARERLTKPTTTNTESRYRLAMGQNYIMKMVTYVSDDIRPSCAIEFTSPSKDGAIVTPEKLLVTSRYNEDRVLIGCKRTLDGLFVPLSIKNGAASPQQSQAGIVEGYLLLQIYVPPLIILGILTCLALASILLSIGPDMIRDLFPGAFSDPLKAKWPIHFATISKALGAVLGIVAGYIGFRKIPLGK